MFCLGVIGLELIVADGPCGRDATVVTNFVEVAFTQTKQCSAVKFRVASDEIVCVWMKSATAGVVPRFFGVVFPIEINCFGAPVILLTRNVIAALEQEYLLA